MACSPATVAVCRDRLRGLFGDWTGAVYLAAWDAGGSRADYIGFHHGQFSYPDALINSATLTLVVVCMAWWKRVRRARKRQIISGPDAAPPSTNP